jgi:hypothetical protein
MNYFPRSDTEFNTFFSNLIRYVNDKVSKQPVIWTQISVEAMNALTKLHDTWNEAFDKLKGPHTTVETLLKNEARKAGEEGLNEFIIRYLLWEPVTDADRLSMNIHSEDNVRTPSVVPTIRVGFEVLPYKIYSVKLKFWVQETDKAHVPANMNGVVVHWLISDTPIENQEELHNSRLLTKHLSILNFAPNQRGKTLYVACRWENRKGKGEWSIIKSVVIP